MYRSKWIRALVASFSLIMMSISGALVGNVALAYSQSDGYSSPAACMQPPTNIDLTTLTDEQLAQYGLPRRPTGGQALQEWTHAIRHAKHHVCTAKRLSVHHTSQESFDNWAGNIAIGGGYQEVQGNWYVPCLSSSPSNGSSSFWVGMGGDPHSGGGNLPQAGTDGLIINGSTQYYAWVENVPNVNTFSPFNVNCGDYMYGQADSNYSKSGQAFTYIEDDSPYDGNYYGMYSKYTSNGSTAEWIAERLDIFNTNDQPLADFGQMSFYSAATIHKGSFQYVGQTTHNYGLMCQGGLWTCGTFSTLLANPGAIVNNGHDFPIYWDACC